MLNNESQAGTDAQQSTTADVTTSSPNFAKPNVVRRLFELFVKRKWSKWQHIMFVQDFRSGIKTYEIMRRECEITGLTQYRRIYVKQCVHGLVTALNNWINNIKN